MDRGKEVKGGRYEIFLHLPGYDANRNDRDPFVNVVLERN